MSRHRGKATTADAMLSRCRGRLQSAHIHGEEVSGKDASPDERLVLLTSDYHMYRALRVFQKAGLNVAPRPFPDIVKRSSSLTERWPAFFELWEESVKTAYYWFRGWI